MVAVIREELQQRAPHVDSYRRARLSELPNARKRCAQLLLPDPQRCVVAEASPGSTVALAKRQLHDRQQNREPSARK